MVDPRDMEIALLKRKIQELENERCACLNEISYDLIKKISPREKEVLSLVGTGADNLKIAALLGVSERTVKAHVSSMYLKIGAENRVELALIALRLRLRPAEF